MRKAYALAAAAALITGSLLLSGCGERTEEPVSVGPATEAATEEITEAVTEAVVIETQPVTEPPTEEPTEAVTEAPTEPPTEADVVLSAEEEEAAIEDLAAAVTYYANDDINVRDTPSTENSDNIISSYDQGEEVRVIAKTPHWYKVEKEDFTGYVFKAGLSETLVEPKSPEEREQAAEGTQSAGTNESSSAPAPSVTAEAVSDYAESFPIEVNSDANVRVAAAENADVFATVSAGTQLTAIGESGNWYQVDYNGSLGYVSKSVVD